MASSRALAAQQSAVYIDQRSKGKDALLHCLTRLNDKSTLRVAAEELSELIKARVSKKSKACEREHLLQLMPMTLFTLL
jgi:hypothetical protein